MDFLRDLLEERFRAAAEAHAAGSPDLPTRLSELRRTVLLAIDRAPLEIMALAAACPEVARLLPPTGSPSPEHPFPRLRPLADARNGGPR
jgi:hypothetical protein